ncbi:hypothetical protein GCM10009552_28550 [Rothia nasimurium]|uniref:Helix-turn-helix transcriptional regulator n=1 Tax=Luteibacter anthropi TaxID=564369 RepID=A0A7X5ZII7_9GAMM|nr:helix-turn-helix transcriptional regulator [Luteibacter anthropi]NII06948.1 helix-turn-helix transcriptional regulator [Luteibacter anthropi]
MPKRQTGTASIHSEEYKAFCGFLAETRVAQGITQVELARRLGVSQPYISHVEKGDVRVDPIQLIRWLEQCEVDPSEWLVQLYARVQRIKPGRRLR